MDEKDIKKIIDEELEKRRLIYEEDDRHLNDDGLKNLRKIIESEYLQQQKQEQVKKEVTDTPEERAFYLRKIWDDTQLLSLQLNKLEVDSRVKSKIWAKIYTITQLHKNYTDNSEITINKAQLDTMIQNAQTSINKAIVEAKKAEANKKREIQKSYAAYVVDIENRYNDYHNYISAMPEGTLEGKILNELLTVKNLINYYKKFNQNELFIDKNRFESIFKQVDYLMNEAKEQNKEVPNRDSYLAKIADDIKQIRKQYFDNLLFFTRDEKKKILEQGDLLVGLHEDYIKNPAMTVDHDRLDELVKNTKININIAIEGINNRDKKREEEQKKREEELRQAYQKRIPEIVARIEKKFADYMEDTLQNIHDNNSLKREIRGYLLHIQRLLIQYKDAIRSQKTDGLKINEYDINSTFKELDRLIPEAKLEDTARSIIDREVERFKKVGFEVVADLIQEELSENLRKIYKDRKKQNPESIDKITEEDFNLLLSKSGDKSISGTMQEYLDFVKKDREFVTQELEKFKQRYKEKTGKEYNLEQDMRRMKNSIESILKARDLKLQQIRQESYKSYNELDKENKEAFKKYSEEIEKMRHEELVDAEKHIKEAIEGTSTNKKDKGAIPINKNTIQTISADKTNPMIVQITTTNVEKLKNSWEGILNSVNTKVGDNKDPLTLLIKLKKLYQDMLSYMASVGIKKAGQEEIRDFFIALSSFKKLDITEEEAIKYHAMLLAISDCTSNPYHLDAVDNAADDAVSYLWNDNYEANFGSSSQFFLEFLKYAFSFDHDKINYLQDEAKAKIDYKIANNYFVYLVGENLKDPLNMGKSSLKDLARGIKFDPADGADIKTVVNAILACPEKAKLILSRPLLTEKFQKNFRRKLGENPALIIKLIKEGDVRVLKAIQETQLLESSHIKDDAKNGITKATLKNLFSERTRQSFAADIPDIELTAHQEKIKNESSHSNTNKSKTSTKEQPNTSVNPKKEKELNIGIEIGLKHFLKHRLFDPTGGEKDLYKIVGYLISHPEKAVLILDKPIAGIVQRNFREELARNPDLIRMLIAMGDEVLLTTIKKSRFLESSHIAGKFNETELEELKAKRDQVVTSTDSDLNNESTDVLEKRKHGDKTSPSINQSEDAQLNIEHKGKNVPRP